MAEGGVQGGVQCYNHSMRNYRIPEFAGRGGRLGRHVHHDDRSLRYLVPPGKSTGDLNPVQHHRQIPVLDQADLGSCTGNGSEGLLGTDPFFGDLLGWFIDLSSDYCERQAVQIYSLATTLDEFSGQYPPDDTGSSGLGVAKACKQLGLISGYRHATTLEDALSALEVRPVLTGVNWYSSFDVPTDAGEIRFTSTAQVRGGHEFVVDELDVAGDRVWFTNSWGLSWGRLGKAWMRWDTWERLLAEEGDVTDFVPINEQPPKPTPDIHDDELAGCLRKFLPVGRRWLKAYDKAHKS